LRHGALKRIFTRVLLPWAVTFFALFLAFRGVEWSLLWSHLKSADPILILAAFILTNLSYFLRAVRWQLLFPKIELPLVSSLKVLILGFFMNNILPARAGELVRAHLGGKVTGEQRTLVLATIASERLTDGLSISLMFVVIIGLFGRGHLDPTYADNLMYVAYLFALVGVGVIATLLFRRKIFLFTNALADRFNKRSLTYTLTKLEVFVDGLSPLCSPRRALQISMWSVLIWGIELLVYMAIAQAFNSQLPLSGAVLFLVAVNFSSLIPAAPGGFGVIELVAKNVLLSLGVASSELALSMVLAQHVIQYVVIGIPGAFMLATLRSQLRDMQVELEERQAAPAPVR
jgi:uncharacterized protein (TIRG00374 family)